MTSTRSRRSARSRISDRRSSTWVATGPDFDRGIEQPGRPHDLLHHLAGLGEFPLRGRRRDVDGLRLHALELVEPQRPVVERRRQAEAVLDQRLLARAVAAVHRLELRQGDVALVDHQQGIPRQVVEQAGRRLAGLAARQVARVVLDARAVAELRDHLEVEQRALLEALRLEQLVRGAKLGQARAKLHLDLVDGLQQPLARRHVVRGREHREARHLAQHLAGQRVEEGERLDLLVEELHAHRVAFRLRREDVHHVAAHAERALAQVQLVPRVLHVGEAPQQLALVHAVPAHEVQHHLEVGLGIAEAVDRRDGGDDDGIGPLEQGLGRRQPHLLDVLVDRGVLLDVGVRGRHVGFRLVVVVVRDEVLDGVAREVLLELAVELRRERLVVREHERRTLHGLDHVRDGVRLSGTGDAKQRLVREARLDAVDERGDGGRLVAGRRVLRLQLEWSRFAHASPELQRKMPSRTLAGFVANRYSP